MSAAMESTEVTESRALVAVGSSQPRRDSPIQRRAAPFLAQLIATRAQAPQTRVHRRAEPAEALAAYRKTSSLREAKR